MVVPDLELSSEGEGDGFVLVALPVFPPSVTLFLLFFTVRA